MMFASHPRHFATRPSCGPVYHYPVHDSHLDTARIYSNDDVDLLALDLLHQRNHQQLVQQRRLEQQRHLQVERQQRQRKQLESAYVAQALNDAEDQYRLERFLQHIMGGASDDDARSLKACRQRKHHHARRDIDSIVAMEQDTRDAQTAALERREKSLKAREEALRQREAEIEVTANNIERKANILEAKAAQRRALLDNKEASLRKSFAEIEKQRKELKLKQEEMEKSIQDMKLQRAAVTIQRQFRNWKATRADVRFLKALRILRRLDNNLATIITESESISGQQPSHVSQISESLTKHLEEADAIASEGNVEIRQRRKAFVRRCMRFLDQLDAMSESSSSDSNSASDHHEEEDSEMEDHHDAVNQEKLDENEPNGGDDMTTLENASIQADNDTDGGHHDGVESESDVIDTQDSDGDDDNTDNGHQLCPDVVVVPHADQDSDAIATKDKDYGSHSHDDENDVSDSYNPGAEFDNHAADSESEMESSAESSRSNSELNSNLQEEDTPRNVQDSLEDTEFIVVDSESASM